MKKQKRRFNKGNVYLVALTALIFLFIATFVAFSTRSMMLNEVSNTIENVVKSVVGRIDSAMASVESAVNNSAWMIREHLDDPDYMNRVVQEIVTTNDYIVGSAVAYLPNKAKGKDRLFAPYCSKTEEDEIIPAFLLYDYSEDTERNEWFFNPIKQNKASWCEPYFDDGGGEMWMCTYSVPIKNDAEEIVAVLTADVSLEGLTYFVSNIHPYKNAYALLRSSGDKPLVSPPKGNERNGEQVRVGGLASNGWRVDLVCPLDEILQSTKSLVSRIILFSLASLGLIFFVSWAFSSRLQRVTAENERIESELSIAKQIQTSALPNIFPPFPQYAQRMDLYAAMHSAKEVGGDFYDFYFVSPDRLLIVIADVSGKGVPAAMFMMRAMATLKATFSAETDFASAMEYVNNRLIEGNTSFYFVTAWIGIIDLKSGEMDFVNAGHNPPVIKRADGSIIWLRECSGVPLALMKKGSYKVFHTTLTESDRLLMYTDGVTEAFNPEKELFKEERLNKLVEGFTHDMSGHDIIHSVFDALTAFANGAEQADDITMLTFAINKRIQNII